MIIDLTLIIISRPISSLKLNMAVIDQLYDTIDLKNSKSLFKRCRFLISGKERELFSQRELRNLNFCFGQLSEGDFFRCDRLLIDFVVSV